jgi:twitching motility protein PilT
VVNSLLTAIVRADGDALVMHVGEQPYVVAASGPVELSSRPLTLEAVAGMLGQLLPSESRRALEELGAIEYELPKSLASSDERFTVVAARGGDDIWIEVRRHRVAAPAAAEAPVQFPEPIFPPAETAVAPVTAEMAPAPAPADAVGEVEIPLDLSEFVAAPSPSAALPTAVVPPSAVEAPTPVPFADLLLPSVVAPASAVEAPMPAPFADLALPPAAPALPPASVLPTPPPLPPSAPVVELPAPAPVAALPAAPPEPMAPPAAPVVPAPPRPTLAVSAPPQERFVAPPPPQERFVAPKPAPVERLERTDRFQRTEPSAPVLPSPALERFSAIRTARPAEPVPPPPAEPMSESQDQVTSQAESSQAVVLPLARNPVRPDTPARASTPPRIAGLDRLLRLAAARGATTIFLMSGGRPSVRVDGEIVPLDGEPILTASEVESLLLDMAPERNREALRNGVGTEWMSDVPEVGRFRCQSFRDHRGPGGIFRMISTRPTSVDQLGLSREIQGLCGETEGLVLVTGARSSGKSTLVTALVDLINRTRNDYLITIESQIACAHESRGCLISQREVRGNGDELAAAVRAGLRENPDVLVIEDLRSPKVVALAVEAMELGHLVIAAMSAHTSTTAIGRILDQTPPERREQVQLALAEGLRGVVSQVLLKKTGGGRVAAREVLLNTPAIASLIADGRISQLPLALDSGRKHGMVPLNDALAAFVQSGVVDVKDAYRQAFERQAFLAVLRREGVDTSFVERLA